MWNTGLSSTRNDWRKIPWPQRRFMECWSALLWISCWQAALWNWNISRHLPQDQSSWLCLPLICLCPSKRSDLQGNAVLPFGVEFTSHNVLAVQVFFHILRFFVVQLLIKNPTDRLPLEKVLLHPWIRNAESNFDELQEWTILDTWWPSTWSSAFAHSRTNKQFT